VAIAQRSTYLTRTQRALQFVTIWRHLAIAGLALAFASTALADPSGSRSAAALPARGLLIGGTSLAGVRLGDSPAAVERAWGKHHTSCNGCALRTWLFIYPDRPVGAAVTFDAAGRAVAVFTLGEPLGWRTQKSLWVGADIHSLTAKYDAPSMAYRACIGYSALSTTRGEVVTSIYTQAESVYGFALTERGQPVCR
jgi:hypothetical protein